VYTRLVPRIEASIVKLIDRPIEMGDVEGFSLTHVQFGETHLPPTDTDADRARVDSIRVSFNPLEVLINRSLSFDVTVRSPIAVLEQDDTGRWLDTTLNELEPGAIKFKLESVEFQDAQVALIPFPGAPLIPDRAENRHDSGSGSAPDADKGRSPDNLPPSHSTEEHQRRLLEFEQATLLPNDWPEIDAPFVWMQSMDGEARFRDDNTRIAFSVEGAPYGSADGGTFEISGELDRRTDFWKANAVIQTERLDITEFILLAPALPADITTGTVSSNIQGRIDATGDLQLQGTAQLRDVGIDLPGRSIPIAVSQSELQFQGQRIQVENTAISIGESRLTAKGRIDLRESAQNAYDLSIIGESLDITALLQDVDIQVPVAIEGQLNTTVNVTGSLQQPMIAGTINQASPIQVDRVALDGMGARFRLLPDALEINTLRVSPALGGVISGNGQVALDEGGALSFMVDVANIPGDAIAQQYLATPFLDSISLGEISAQAQITGTVSRPIVNAQWKAPGGTYPSQGTVLALDNRVSLRDIVVEVGDGQVQAESDLSLDDQRWRATLTLDQLQLASLVPDQADRLGASVLTGDLSLAGSLQDLSPSAITGEGQLNLADLPMLDGPLVAQGRWLGNGLQLDEAIAPNLEVSGFIGIDIPTDGTGTFDRSVIHELDLTVRAQTIDLAQGAALLRDPSLGGLTDDTAASTTPAPFPASGVADFDGQVTGSLTQPTVDGDLSLRNLVINEIAFERQLDGRVQFTLGQGGTVDLEGTTDRIFAIVDERYYPRDFELRRGAITARGTQQGDRLETTIENFPLGALNLTPAENLGLGPLAGALSGTISVDLATLNLSDFTQLSASGSIEIVNPSLGHIEGDRFAGQFVYGNEVALINRGVLVIGSSQYDVVGRFAPTRDTLFTGQIEADNGNIQDLLVALKYFELQDLLRFFDPPQYGTADDLDLLPIRITEATLLRQLQRYAEISTLLSQNREEEAETTFFPALQELSGTISGRIDLTVARDSGLTAEFDLTGENWEWGEYADPNQIIAKGRFSGNSITLLPFQFKAGDTLVEFAGQVGQDEESRGQMQISNVPAELVADFIRLPIDIEGNLNTTAVISGSINNPQARGEFSFEEGVINQTPIQETNAQFRYADARLILIGSMLVDGDDPINVTGSVPYRLPQGRVEPASDEINLNIDIKNDGLALLNVLNNQINWTGGEASVSLQVGGTLQQTSSGIDIQPLATGFAELQNGSFSAEVLPAPLTNVTGTIDFNRDRIQVNNVRGQFSDGEFLAQGIIPLAGPFKVKDPTSPEDTDADLAPETPEEPLFDPLTVNLNDLEIDVKGLYDGSVNGQIVVRGTALAPLIGGEVTLSDGRVSLPDPTVLGVATPIPDETNPFATLFSPPELNDLKVILGNRLLITRAPILNFVATGDLVVNGPLEDFRNLMPNGVIRLRSGQVNLFTTQFNLLRRRDNVAVFRPDDGLDPFLNVQLATSILEQTRSPIPTSTAFAQSELSEVLDSSANDFGGVETVRVQATVVGPASQIFEELELRSSPSRTENEILALIGGGFADTQGQDGSNLAIASLAGTALFTSLQNVLSNALGISDFRIFPAVITDDEREDGRGDRATSTLGIAAELGVDLTSDLSVSALQFLTLEQPTQFNLRYQISDEFRLRGTTNFSDENRLVLEFETRF
jgi:translocation and assembly module TamB